MLKAMLSPITRFLHPHTRVTFRCRDHDNLAREIDKRKHEIHVSNLQRLPKKSNKSILVQYSTVLYCTVKMSVEINSFYPAHPLHIPHPSHQSLSRRKIFEEEERCRIALRERTGPHQIRWPAAAQSSKAHLLESKVTQRTLAISLKRRRQWSKVHCMEKVTSLRGRIDPHLALRTASISCRKLCEVMFQFDFFDIFFFLFLL